MEAVDWPALRTDSGNGAGIPQALTDLWEATSEEMARDAYWRIDNEVLVQGQLYEAAVPTLEALLSLASMVPPGPARKSVAELIQQIIFGQPHASEVELGNSEIGIKCRDIASGAVWIFYGWLADEDSDVRELALLSLCKTENEGRRKSVVFSALRRSDTSSGVRAVFSEIDRGLY